MYLKSQQKCPVNFPLVGIPLHADGMCWTLSYKSDPCVGTVAAVCSKSKIPTDVYRSKLRILGLAFSPCEMLPEQLHQVSLCYISGPAVNICVASDPEFQGLYLNTQDFISFSG